MQCALYDAGRCRSCQWITQPIPEQLSAKTADLKNLLADFPVEEWCAPVSGPEQGFRNKAKMVVSGSVEKPLLGMLHRDGTPEDLCDCPLYPASFAPVFAALKPFIARAGLTPYNVARKRGELKYILLTESQSDGGMMLRFVLRSETKLAQLRKALPWLQEQLPQLKVITVNIQPVHMAIMEGETEIYLTEQQALAERFNDVPLWIRPQSFFQTNPAVASQLYATARDWVRQLPVKHMWDLFCGVGGFGLHCATPDMQLTGIEIASEAIACAKQSAAELGLTRLQFQALDSTQFATAQGEVPELVLVNPPRRGIGKPLCDYLSGFGLHCATPDMQLTGIEIASEAIACAKQSAAELGLTRLQFQALDSTQFATAQGEVPELVLVNPPRRGIGKPLCDYLSTMAPRFIIYSSCNAQTMAKDIRELPGYRIERVQLFDMFPHTAHYEVMTLLVKQ
ncbi:23S rRNA (uracil(747)-C(5))-methyltransferase RlmC [Escherichia coli]|nr:23S rRNA (uracil(747)-C(5))-methyltransferase RlmC [Escherichia coli]